MADPNSIRAGGASIEFHADLSKLATELRDNKGIVDALNDSFGRGSDLGKLAKLFAGGGAVFALGKITSEIAHVGEAMKTAAEHGDNIGLALLKNLPIVGNLYKGLSDIADVIDGTVAETTMWNNAMKALTESGNAIHKVIQDTKKDVEDLAIKLAKATASPEELKFLEIELEHKKAIEEIDKKRLERERELNKAKGETEGVLRSAPTGSALFKTAVRELTNIENARIKLHDDSAGEIATADKIRDVERSKAQGEIDKKDAEKRAEMDRKVAEYKEKQAQEASDQFDKDLADQNQKQKDYDDELAKNKMDAVELLDKRLAKSRDEGDKLDELKKKEFEKMLGGLSHTSQGTFSVQSGRDLGRGFAIKTRTEEDVAVMRDLFQRLWNKIQTGQGGLTFQ